MDSSNKEKIKVNEKLKEYKTYSIYTILFCAISFIVFAVFFINNKTFIWQGDGIKQHFTILYDYNQILRNIFQNGIQTFSWNMGLGLDIIGQYSYYIIGDPFAYLSLLFPMEKLESVYNFLVLLRMYCVGIAFIAYCRYRKKENLNTIIGAIIYTFCGFILYAGIRHPYFTNAAILLPLNLIGIEKLLKENKKKFLIFIVFLSAISNYYFFYMITIINILYAIVKYIFEYNRGVRECFKLIGRGLLCYIVGILMASVILLPTIYAFLNSARTNSEPVRTYIVNYYKYLYIGLISMRFKNWTVICVSSIVLLMVPILITKLKDKEAKSYFTFLIITTIMLLLPISASMMNGFSFPSNRWVFAYSFILSYITTICFDSKLKYTKKQKIFMFIMLLIYSIIGILITKFKIKANLDYYASIVIAFIIFFFLIYNYKKERWKKYARFIIVILVIGTIVVNSLALYSKEGKGYAKEYIDNNSVYDKCESANGKIENFKEAIEYIKENDKEFYRISKKDTSYQNLSLLYDYNPIQLYLSLGNKNVFNLSCDLEDNCYTSTRCINGADRRTKYTTLLGNKYFICDKKDLKYVPYGYELYYEIGNTQIYKNENYLSAGVIYDSYITKEEYEKLSSIEKEDALITTAMIEEDKIMVEKENKNEINSPIKLSYSVKDNKISNNFIQINKKNETIELKIDKLIANTEIYLNIRNLKFEPNNKSTDFKISAKLNGIKNSENLLNKNSSAYYMEKPNFLMNLGVVTEEKEVETLKITFDNKGVYSFDALEVLAVDMPRYESKIDKLKENQLQNIEYGNNFITGTANSDKVGILQISTSYSKGWRVFVDGKEQDVIKVNEAFIGTVVEAGEHFIEFKYETPYLKLGIIVSGLGLLIYLYIIIKSKKRNN